MQGAVGDALMRDLSNMRLRQLHIALLTVAIVVLARVVWIQAVEGDAYAQRARQEEQATFTLHAARGRIFDRTGAVLATNEPARTVWADPREVQDPKSAAETAGGALGVDVSTLTHQLSLRASGFVYVARQVDVKAAAQFMRIPRAGFGVYSDPRRHYPFRTLAPQVIGHVNPDGHGTSGIELRDDRALRGMDGRETIDRDALGRILRVVSRTPPSNGRDIVLTIDHTMQSVAESVLASTVRRAHASMALALVADPLTGALLTIAIAPTYDANSTPTAQRNIDDDRAITEIFEPHRALAPLIAAAAVVADSTSAPLRTLSDAISSAGAMGPQYIARFLERFGFGSKTGVGLPGEARGIVLPASRWTSSTRQAVIDGTDIAVTPVQLLSAYVALANRGALSRLHLVQRIGGTPVVNNSHRVVPASTAAAVLSMLAQGSAAPLVAGYRVAAIGASPHRPSSGGFGLRDVATMVGIAPAEHPRLVVLVALDSPRSVAGTSNLVTSAFNQIVTFDLQYLQVPTG